MPFYLNGIIDGIIGINYGIITKEGFMGTAADTLVTKYPSRVAQLAGPVLTYLKARSKGLPFNGTDQDLYMAVFYPVARRWNPKQEFSAKVKRDNPGIKTPQDYVNFVNKRPATVQLTPSEWTALKDTASRLGTNYNSLYKLINFESGWNPKATNPISGARGLIQFMPSTAFGMGFAGAAKKAGIGLTTILMIAGAGYFIAKKMNLI